MRRLIALVAVSLALCLSAGTPAYADDPPVTDDPSGGVTTVIHLPGSPGGPPGSPAAYDEGVSLNPCSYRFDPSGMVAENYDFDQPGAPTTAQLDAGLVRWYAVACPGKQQYTVWVLVGQPAPGPPPPTPGELAVLARKYMPLPKPAVQHNPTEQGLVNLPTWFWLTDDSWGVHSSILTLRGTTVVAVATPKLVQWQPGTGATVTCKGQGRPYLADAPAKQQSTYCSYTYLRSSAGLPGLVYSGTATSVWAVHWIGNAPGQPTEEGDLEDLRLTAPFTLGVAEVQTVVTSSG